MGNKMKAQARAGLVFFNRQRASYVFGVLEKQYREGEGRYGLTVPPEIFYLNSLTELRGDPRKMVLFYFFVALFMRGGINSDDPFFSLGILCKIYPEMFEPEEIIRMSSPEIGQKLEEASLIALGGATQGESNHGSLAMNIREHTQNWRNNARCLSEYWEGDPRKIFQGQDNVVSAFNNTVDRHDRFGGMRLKIFSLLAIWYMEQELIPKMPCPLPVDFHMIRLFLGLGLIKINKKVWQKFQPGQIGSEKNRVDNGAIFKALRGRPAFRVTEQITNSIALWTMGMITKLDLPIYSLSYSIWFKSRTDCSAHIQSQSRNGPNGQRMFFTEEALAQPGLIPKNYWEPCADCVFQADLCRSVVPAFPYYRLGFIVPIKRKPSFGQQTFRGISPFPGRRTGKATLEKLERHRQILALAPDELRALGQSQGKALETKQQFGMF
ncbi:MAG: hypothetical protein COV31_01140 [Candidatus Yanofskybacteria bacterium CG10_big_fil_rev_8_21_14_0_10_46_23]|uniref:Uncharacterized protein n=1 Tax=Candidatus Yanofskybacteria bacterium CG10_big_fil_rev_8_21_14_0_10_46_23 TaxID=1975098 RepID=A0A2H0R4L5_9BACT|nr:MAG: hypothetical protein COV31_01140 [Candidatus Yanofskybacteria bacterium CG10_big_fil_rev_8_21_14_0_10_46_23]